MAESESNSPCPTEQFSTRVPPTIEWTSSGSFDLAVAEALANSLDVTQQEFVLQESIDVDALAQLVGAKPDSPAPDKVMVSFRLDRYECTVLVDSDGIQVWHL